jgi:hypothetical protein
LFDDYQENLVKEDNQRDFVEEKTSAAYSIMSRVYLFMIIAIGLLIFVEFVFIFGYANDITNVIME